MIDRAKLEAELLHTDCANGEHRAMRDYFADLPGVSRSVPGNVYCGNCKEPLPYWWNGGKPKSAESEGDSRG